PERISLGQSPTACREHDRSAAFTPLRCSAGERPWTDPTLWASSTALWAEARLKPAPRTDFARAIVNCMSRTQPEPVVHAAALSGRRTAVDRSNPLGHLHSSMG